VHPCSSAAPTSRVTVRLLASGAQETLPCRPLPMDTRAGSVASAILHLDGCIERLGRPSCDPEQGGEDPGLPT
jgi:hypothetical protein